MGLNRLLSADSHVVEPADVWTARIDARYRDRAPHVEKEGDGVQGDFFVCEGLRPFPVSGFAVAGVDNLMWASDFPHSDSTWPRSQEVIARDFAGVPESETQKIIADNCAVLYGLG